MLSALQAFFCSLSNALVPVQQSKLCIGGVISSKGGIRYKNLIFYIFFPLLCCVCGFLSSSPDLFATILLHVCPGFAN